MANNVRKVGPSYQTGKTPPPQPDYPDEITPEQIAVIRAHLDPDGQKAASRKVLYTAGW